MSTDNNRFQLVISLYDDANPEGIASALEKAAENIRKCASRKDMKFTHNRPFGAAYRMWYGIEHPALK